MKTHAQIQRAQRPPQAQTQGRGPKRKRGERVDDSGNGDREGDGDGGSQAGETRERGTETETWSAPWVDGMDLTGCESKEERLHAEIVAFFNYMSPTPDERHARAVAIAHISEAVRQRFAGSTVDTFGSVAQNLYLPDGDTDLVVNTARPFNDEAKKRALFQLAALMRNTGITVHVQVIPRARVPVMSFETVPDLGLLKIDISFNAADGVKAVPILRDWFDRLPALRFLVLCVKSLLSRHRLNNAASSGLSSYGVICLAIHFLLARPAADVAQPLEHRALGRLLAGFLDYYGNVFDYARAVVSVHAGVLTKEEKGWENPNFPEGLCIECMLNPENDVGRPTSKIRRIRQVFRESHAALEAYVFADSPDARAHNILGTILGISESTLAHRALIREVVASGRLSHALRNAQLSTAALTQSQSQGQNGGNAFARRQQHQQQQGYPRQHQQNQNGLPSRIPPPGAPEAAASAGPSTAAPAQKTRYVAQGPSFAALREKAEKAKAEKEKAEKEKGKDQEAEKEKEKEASAEREQDRDKEKGKGKPKGKGKAKGKKKDESKAAEPTTTQDKDNDAEREKDGEKSNEKDGESSKTNSSAGSVRSPPRRRRKKAA